MIRLLALLPLLLLPSCSQAQPVRAPSAAEEIERRLTTVSRASVAQAIDQARRDIAANPGARVLIRLPAGAHDLSGGPPDTAAIDVSGVNACPGQLTVAGAGPARTTVIKDDDLTGVLGRDSSCVTIADLTLMQRRLEVSQGRVVAASKEAVVLDIPRGFPTPGQLMAVPPATDSQDRARYWLIRYIATPAGPQIAPDERAVRWDTAEPVSGTPNRWRLNITNWRGTAVFRVGDLIGIKTKSGGQAYRFTGGHDITLRNMRWVNDGRGKFRNVDRVTVENSTIARPSAIEGVEFALSTSGGGPQIGHLADRTTTGHLVQNNVFEGTGDDAIAFANASGTIRNNRITDVTRGIFVTASPDVRLENNDLTRAPIVNRPRAKAYRGSAANDN